MVKVARVLMKVHDTYIFIFWQSSHRPEVQKTSRNTATHLVSNQKFYIKAEHSGKMTSFPFHTSAARFVHTVQSQMGRPDS